MTSTLNIEDNDGMTSMFDNLVDRMTTLFNILVFDRMTSTLNTKDNDGITSMLDILVDRMTTSFNILVLTE